MSEKRKLGWECIDSKSRVLHAMEDTCRFRVPDGWLVRYKYFGGKWMSANCITYFPDKDGEWDIENIKWELIDEPGGQNEKRKTYRMKVIGGWIVRDDYKTIQQGVDGKINHLNLSMTFVPDEEHIWEIDE